MIVLAKYMLSPGKIPSIVYFKKKKKGSTINNLITLLIAIVLNLRTKFSAYSLSTIFCVSGMRGVCVRVY